MGNELKPCPFCGGHARLFRKPIFSIDGGFMANDGSYYIVVCDTPSCASVGYYGHEQAAINAWNMRANPVDKNLTDEEQEILNDMPALRKLAIIAGFNVK